MFIEILVEIEAICFYILLYRFNGVLKWNRLVKTKDIAILGMQKYKLSLVFSEVFIELTLTYSI